MKVLFLHGFGSDPNGVRPTFLKGHGHEVIHPALPDHDFEESVGLARRALRENGPDVVVGSSRGGAVCLALGLQQTPQVLVAPAWKKWNATATIRSPALILHSDRDDVVPLGESRELLRRSGLPESRLIVVGANHRMVDAEAFQALLEAIEQLAAP